MEHGIDPRKVHQRLVRRGLVTGKRLEELEQRSAASGTVLEELLIGAGIPKHEVLLSLAGHYGVPFVEFDESVIASFFLLLRLAPAHLKEHLWFPLSLRDGRADVIACRPDDPLVIEDIRRTLGAEHIDFRIALPADLIRIIEHNFDLNPRFPVAGGRTPLALVRTYLAARRSAYAHVRTLLAKGRTGLSFIRTGVAFLVISLLFLRVLGAGWFLLLEAPLLLAGVFMVADGIRWYWPSRAAAEKPVDSSTTDHTWSSSVLEASLSDGRAPEIGRGPVVEGAAELRAGWENLSPVMRRRFLASDRTDMAEERTSLAGFRTKLARARTGMAFARTGIAFIGLGIGLLRQFPAGRWTSFDLALITAGLLMSAEGFIWYFGGRKAGRESLASVLEAVNRKSIWDLVLPLRHNRRLGSTPPVRADHAPGIWATTGLALERTVLADRRGVMARLRTAMAVARTGMAHVRTGMSIASVGAGLMVYFGAGSTGWTIFNVVLIASGLALIADGYRWIMPAERLRSQYPYCFGGMELTVPDYGRPAREWGTVVFDQHE